MYSRIEKGLDSLVQTVRLFSEDIGMEFGIEKCAMLVMEKGKIVKSFAKSSHLAAFVSWRKSELQATYRKTR